eukprot:TRINITY_DN7847_c0_g1_i3.p1 TRINITY_DN7847_c0_g1~~TRINITY_DN7847_c0_g1_i3.p1  ORF type:complete len:140 (-),score=46.93 TRINITY_DN7847_c0_g1_i3:114-533(-)
MCIRDRKPAAKNGVKRKKEESNDDDSSDDDDDSSEDEKPKKKASPKVQSAKKQKVQGERFQRVKAEEATYEDQFLKDNTYEGTFGADGWGAKASAILLQTKGKGFRHEKTKKKRGTYKGGKIDDCVVNSYKFQYSDEDE